MYEGTYIHIVVYVFSMYVFTYVVCNMNLVLLYVCMYTCISVFLQPQTISECDLENSGGPGKLSTNPTATGDRAPISIEDYTMMFSGTPTSVLTFEVDGSIVVFAGFSTGIVNRVSSRRTCEAQCRRSIGYLLRQMADSILSVCGKFRNLSSMFECWCYTTDTVYYVRSIWCLWLYRVTPLFWTLWDQKGLP